jgi:pyrimidine operon attenuation protein/uracil phosphoribosyltransferase
LSESLKHRLIDHAGMERTINRLATEIVEDNHGVHNLALIGIRTRGAPLAERIAEKIQKLEGHKIPVGVLDITLYRDDFMTSTGIPEVKATEIPFDIHNMNLVLVDDVLYTGRTSRAAIEAIMDYGRPSIIRLAVLIDRGHREMPIQGDFIGRKINISPGEAVKVKLTQIDDVDEVVIIESASTVGETD